MEEISKTTYEKNHMTGTQRCENECDLTSTNIPNQSTTEFKDSKRSKILDDDPKVYCKSYQ